MEVNHRRTVALKAASKIESKLLARAFNALYPNPKSMCVTRPDLLISEEEYGKIKHLLTPVRTSLRTEG